MRIDTPGDHMRVGDCWLSPAAPIARRARLCAGAKRSDMQRTRLVKPGNGTAAGANLDDVDRRHVDGIACIIAAILDPVIRCDLGFAPFDQRRLRRCTANIQRDHVRLIQELTDSGCPDDARNGPGLDRVYRQTRSAGKCGAAAIRLHDVPDRLHVQR